MDKNVIEIGQVLRSLRRAAKLSQADLSKKTDIPRTVIAEIEGGSSSRSFGSYAASFAKAFGQQVWDLERFWILSASARLEADMEKANEQLANQLSQHYEETRQGILSELDRMDALLTRMEAARAKKGEGS